MNIIESDLQNKYPLPKKTNAWTIYALNNCPHSIAAKELMYSRNDISKHDAKAKPITIQIWNVSSDQKEQLNKQLSEANLLGNHNTFPIIYKKDKLFGGNSDLQDLYRNPF